MLFRLPTAHTQPMRIAIIALMKLLKLARTTKMSDRQTKSMETALTGVQKVTVQVQTHRLSRSKEKEVKGKAGHLDNN